RAWRLAAPRAPGHAAGRLARCAAAGQAAPEPHPARRARSLKRRGPPARTGPGRGRASAPHSCPSAARGERRPPWPSTQALGTIRSRPRGPFVTQAPRTRRTRTCLRPRARASGGSSRLRPQTESRRAMSCWAAPALMAGLPLANARAPVAQGLFVHEDSRVSMACTYAIRVYGREASTLRAAASAALDEVDRIDRLMSHYKPESPLSRLNREAAHGPVVTDPELFDFLAECLR